MEWMLVVVETITPLKNDLLFLFIFQGCEVAGVYPLKLLTSEGYIQLSILFTCKPLDRSLSGA